MGITGLLDELRPHLQENFDIRELKGETVGVDAYHWLYKGGQTCFQQLINGEETKDHIKYCEDRIKDVKGWGLKPHLIFDGDELPLKATEGRKRLSKKIKALASPTKSKNNKHSLKITPMHARDLIEKLKEEDIPFTVAPYEADSQMAYMFKRKEIGAVISSDSDLMAYGCSNILYEVVYEKGTCLRFECEWPSSMDEIAEIPTRKPNEVGDQMSPFEGFSRRMFLETCVLSGCDYYKGLHDMNIRDVIRYMSKYKSAENIFKQLGEEKKKSVSHEDRTSFENAMSAFQHAVVYDPTGPARVRLSGVDEEDEQFPLLGELCSSESFVIEAIAIGMVHPVCKILYSDKENLNEALARIQLLPQSASSEVQNVEIDSTQRYKRYPELLETCCHKLVYRGFDIAKYVEVRWSKMLMGNGHLSVELESLQHLRHDNIIAVYRVWLDGFNLNLITEPCTFRNIREFTRKHGPVCDVHLKDWCSQILKALSCLHTNSPSITHRSLNCTNIFISEATGQIKLGAVEDGLTNGIECMASFIKEEKRYVASNNMSEDIFCFGLCLLEMATLECPYEEYKIKQLKKKLKDGVLPLPSSMEKLKERVDLQAIIKKCLAKLPTDRPSATDLLKDPFFSE